jgi:ABC-type proline/glycine betaine transport system permease subunit
LKETVGSLRTYFILIGLVTAADNVFALARSGHVLLSIFLAMQLVVALAFIAVGLALRPVLRRGTLPITIFIGAGVVGTALSFLLGLLFGQIQVVMLGGIAINLYLLRNGRRLAREAETSPSGVSASSVAGSSAG